MQINSLRVKAYRSWTVDETTPLDASDRIHKLEIVARLRGEGCSMPTARGHWLVESELLALVRSLSAPGASRIGVGQRRPCRVRQAQWTRHHEQQVWRLRRLYPTWGTLPIQRVLARDHGIDLSVSMGGRILAKGVRLGRNQPASSVQGPLKPGRRRPCRAQPKRWRYGMKGRRPGELVQLGHMTVRFPDGSEIKEFKAVCPVSKQMVTRVYTRATAHNAKRFLETPHAELPIPLRSLQVDGGSEFMAGFEQACLEAPIPLCALLPRRPQYNGCVERANASTRYEFYAHHRRPLNVAAINRALRTYQDHYNGYRPH